MREASSMRTWTNFSADASAGALAFAVAGDAGDRCVQSAREFPNVDVDSIRSGIGIFRLRRTGSADLRSFMRVQTGAFQHAADGRR